MNLKTDEIEIVSYPIIENLKVFFVNLINRTTHLHQEIEICCLINGKMGIATQSSSFTAEKGTVILFNSNEPHSLYRVEGPSTVLSIQISPDVFKKVFPEIRNIVFKNSITQDDCSDTERSMILSDMYDTAKDYCNSVFGVELSVFSHVFSLMYKVLKSSEYKLIDHDEYSRRINKQIRINRIVNYINENLSRRITLAEIAERESITKNYISHFFRENLNISFQEYLSNLRFEKALKLLTATELNIIDISLECGFSDSKYLNKAFLRNCGVLPKEYRKRIKEAKRGRDINRAGMSPYTSQYIYHEKKDISLLLEQLKTLRPDAY